MRSAGRIRVVTPGWVLDCISARRRLPEARYALLAPAAAGTLDGCARAAAGRGGGATAATQPPAAVPAPGDVIDLT